MRTVNPEKWSTRIKGEQKIKRGIFGSQTANAFEIRLRSSLADAVKDFWENSSNEGIKYMRERDIAPSVRRCYIVTITLFSLFGFLVIVHDWHSYRSQPPLMINLQSTQHPVQHVDFPAVAICSFNVISRKALKEYATYLYSLDKNETYTLEAIEENLLNFGALQTWSNVPVDVAFMQYLARVARETNVTNIIIRLTPKCSSYLERCSWRMVRSPCDRLLGLRATPHGFCCIFNSRYSEEDIKNPIQKLNFVGEDAGLALVVKENDSDVAYVRGPGEGVEVLLFDGSEYPMTVGGSTKIYRTQRNVSAFFKLSVTAQYTAPGMQRYSEEWRGCRIRAARRSQAWCVAACRRRTVRALCACAPHHLLPRPTDTVCSLDHLACLNKHKEKLMYLYPGDDAHPSLSEEVADALMCEHCLPDCARLAYSAAVSHADYQFSQKLFLNFFVKGLNTINTTIIRIYYASEDQKMYMVESNLRWFEVFAGLGSRWLCLLAVTTVSMVEILYFFTVRWGHHYIRRKRLDTSHNVTRYAPSVGE